MLKWFICPDGERVEVQTCLGRCRMSDRCLTLPTLKFIGDEREWTGEPSTTQLLNGTMYEWLKITQDYAIVPESRAFALLGSIHHSKLEDRADELGLLGEISITDNERNIFDLLELVRDKGEPYYCLTDYKTWGSFKVARSFGIIVVREYKEAYVDKAGRNRERTKRIFGEVPERADIYETALQLNRYRMLLMEHHDIEVKRLQVQVTVRDGGLQVATNRGVDRLMYKRDIPILDDREVESYFTEKAINLQYALDNGWTDICTPTENWETKRCEGYCEVWEHCPAGRQAKIIQKGEE